MQYVRLGKSGLKVSRICFGCMSFGSDKWQPWVLNGADAVPLIKDAYEKGVNFFDTANVYSNGESERVLGAALKQLEIPRERVVIATKLFFRVGDGPGDNTVFQKTEPSPKTVNQGGLSRKHIFEAVEQSLARLQTTYIDLYQIHRWDPDTPIEETMEALNDLVRSGKVRYIGASSMWAWQFAKANAIAERSGWAKFVSMQNYYNLIYREEEREMIPYCLDAGVGLIPWSPLAQGVLTGRKIGETARSSTARSAMFYDSLTEADTKTIERVKELAEKYSVSQSTIAIAWLLTKDAVSAPIVGISKTKYLDDAIEALRIKLTSEEVSYLEELYKPRPIFGH